MKKIYLFCTKWWHFLCVIPPLFIFALSIYYNDIASGTLKLYPLIVISGGFSIFVFLYFFRLVSVSLTELRTIGPFSTRDCVKVDEGKTIIISRLPKSRILIELEGVSDAPSFSWAKGGEYEEWNINLFRQRVVGGKGDVKRLLSAFGIDRGDVDLMLNNPSFEKDYDGFTINATNTKTDHSVKIKLTKSFEIKQSEEN